MSDTDKLKCELYDEVVNEKNKQYIELACRFRETCNDIKKKDKEIERLKLHIMKIKEAISTWNIENDEGHNDFKIPNKIIDIVWSDN